MNTLDSRVIRPGNCYAHRFSTDGTFIYSLSLLPTSLRAHEDEPPARSIVVRQNDGGPQRQHHVVVRADGTGITATPTHVEIAAGDLVTWSADPSLAFGFRVRGRIDGHVIDSSALHTESIFTHAFGRPGVYGWADANGSEIHGQVHVGMPDPSQGQESWLEELSKGTLIHVHGGHVHPARVDVVVGQTVVWAVEDAPGISITQREQGAPGK
jgi:plastocyanin